MAKQSIEFDKTGYFNLLKESVERSEAPFSSDEIIKLMKGHLGDDLNKFNVKNIQEELFAPKAVNDGGKYDTYHTLKYEAFYKYLEMVELKESRIASREASRLAMIAIIIATISFFVSAAGTIFNITTKIFDFLN